MKPAIGEHIELDYSSRLTGSLTDGLGPFATDRFREYFIGEAEAPETLEKPVSHSEILTEPGVYQIITGWMEVFHSLHERYGSVLKSGNGEVRYLLNGGRETLKNCARFMAEEIDLGSNRYVRRSFYDFIDRYYDGTIPLELAYGRLASLYYQTTESSLNSALSSRVYNLYKEKSLDIDTITKELDAMEVLSFVDEGWFTAWDYTLISRYLGGQYRHTSLVDLLALAHFKKLMSKRKTEYPTLSEDHPSCTV